MTGTTETRLVVLRGNSAAGKSTISGLLRDALGPGLAIIEQDHVRRIVLSEDDRPDSANIGLISSMARFCLDVGFDVLAEGIMTSDRYGAMLLELTRDHAGVTRHFYLEVDFAESVSRHTTRDKASDFDVERMRSWYRHRDLLAGVDQEVISGETSAVEASLHIAGSLGLIRGHRRHRPAAAI